MEGADRFDVEGCGFLQHVLNLCAVFADDADIVAGGFTGPAFGIFHIIGAKFAKCIRREEDFVRAVISHHDFRPVNHRSKDKIQDVGAQFQRVAGLYGLADIGGNVLEELIQHGKCFGISHNNRIRIGFHEFHDAGGVVRLHVLDDEIVNLAAVQLRADIVQPFIPETDVDGIEESRLPVKDQVGIVSHAGRNDILSLKEIDLMVVDADIADIICDEHSCFSLSFLL